MERNRPYRIKAFTIIELMVTLAISALVVAMGYTAYRLVGKLYQNNRQEQEATEEVVRFQYLITKDLKEADLIQLAADGLAIRTEKGELNYYWENKQTIRKQSTHLDTFDIERKNWVASFMGKEVFEGTIDLIAMDLMHQQALKVVFRKEYPAATMMNVERLNEY